jgi:hypothetical protein
MIKNVLFALITCFFGACNGQQNDPTILQKFKHPTFHAPSQEVQKQLMIPFLDGDLYGLCDYEGKILLKPQFEAIEMPLLGLPFLQAKKNGNWSVYDLSGNQVLPTDVKMPNLTYFQTEFKGMTGRNYNYYLKLQDPRLSYLKPLELEKKENNSNAQIVEDAKPQYSPPRYFYFAKNTKPPFQSWFYDDNYAYYQFSKKTNYYNGAFTSGSQYGLLKVMDENRYCTLLDEKDMQPIFSPVFNCAAISPTKVMILKENGLCALRDLKKGWQTDFIFLDVDATENPDLCRAEAKIEGKVVKYKIDANGKITILESEYSWLAIDETYSIIGEKAGEYQIDFFLFDEKMGKKVRKLPHHRIAKIFETGIGIYANTELLGIETLKGDTIWRPPYPRFSEIDDSMYVFLAGDTSGLATRDNHLIYSIVKGEILGWGDGFFQVKKDGKLGLITYNGRVVLPIEFDKISPMRNAKRLIVSKNGLFGLYDLETGREILPIQLKHISPNALVGDRKGCFEIKIGKDFFVLNPDLEVIHQKTEKPIVLKSDFHLKSNVSEAIKADFEMSEMPRFFTPFCIFKGKKWQHIFRCNGEYITSVEGFEYSELVYLSGTESNEEVGSMFETGVAKFSNNNEKSVWVRLEDGFLYKK